MQEIRSTLEEQLDADRPEQGREASRDVRRPGEPREGAQPAYRLPRLLPGGRRVRGAGRER